jgi:molybdate transport system ATP-binding protein
MLTGTVRDTTFSTANGASLTVDADTQGATYAAIAPQAIALYNLQPEGSPRNVWPTIIVDIDRHFDRARVTLGDPLPITAELTGAGLTALGSQPGDPIWASVKATEITTYPA